MHFTIKEQNMYCESCGKEIGNVRFCPHCGVPTAPEPPVERNRPGRISGMIGGAVIVMLVLIWINYLVFNMPSLREHRWDAYQVAGVFAGVMLLVSVAGLVLGIIGVTRRPRKWAWFGLAVNGLYVVGCIVNLLVPM